MPSIDVRFEFADLAKVQEFIDNLGQAHVGVDQMKCVVTLRMEKANKPQAKSIAERLGGKIIGGLQFLGYLNP